MNRPMFEEGDGGSVFDANSIVVLAAEQAWELVERLCDPWAQTPKCSARSVSDRVANAIDLAKLRQYLDDFGALGRFRIHTGANGRSYVILLGDPVRRTFLKGTRYLLDNPKVLEFAVGMRGFLRRAAGGVSVLKVGLLAAGITMDVVFGILEDGDLWSEIPKAVLKSALSVLAGAAAATMVAGVGLAALPVMAGVVAGIAVDYGYDKLDARFGISQGLGNALRRSWESVEGHWHDLEFELGRRIQGFEESLIRRATMAW